jgi:hypothetical protein
MKDDRHLEKNEHRESLSYAEKENLEASEIFEAV